MTLHHFTAADGARLAYRDQGGGLALLCLSGLTRTMADFDYLLPHLPPLRLIRMDYRGRGASDWTGAATYTVAQEAMDAVALLDHLGVERAAVIGTSRGGLIGLHLARAAHDRLAGLCLVDIGPELELAGLAKIIDYVGRNPSARSHDDLAQRLPQLMTGFEDVPPERWLEEARKHYLETPQGLRITYDPALREIFTLEFSTAHSGPPMDLWADFNALAGLPVAVIRGANSDLLSAATVDRMATLRPDLIHAEVPGRAHIPFLDEAPSLAVIRAFLKACQ